MRPASLPGRRWLVPWVVVLLGTAACGASEERSSVVTGAASTPTSAPPSEPMSTVPVRPPELPPAEGPASSSLVPRSDLADLVSDVGSALYDPSDHRLAPVPIGVSIPDLEIEDASVVPVGVTDNGDLDVPDPLVVGWYRYGPSPGQPGATVLAAHVNFNRVPGVFRYLRDLEPGAAVTVSLSDGSKRPYIVTDVRLVDKDDLSELGVWRRDGDETLALVTCGGRFNDNRRRYEDNVVAMAVPG